MFQLSESDQLLLLKIARNSVRSYLSGEMPSIPDVTSGPLAEHHGAFVSIHIDSRLRGCIGNLHPTSTLSRTITECAISAAVGDPRFLPLTFAELQLCDFEISVLSPLEKVTEIESIEIGRDGLLISKGGMQGLLLPQVATTYGWDRERFLAETCRKASLHPDEWKRGPAIYRFSAHIFDEKRLREKVSYQPPLTT